MHDGQSQFGSIEWDLKQTKANKIIASGNTPSRWRYWLTAAHLVYAMSDACIDYVNNVHTEWDSWSCPPREEENELLPPWMKFKGFARALTGAQFLRRRSSKQSA